MRIFIIISYCISATAFGMHYNDSYFENYFSTVMTSIAKNQKSYIPNSNAEKTWINPVEALTALGMLQDKTVEEDTNESPCIKCPTESSIQQTPEWYMYINWDQPENNSPSTSTKDIEIRPNKTKEDIQIKPKPISNHQTHCPYANRLVDGSKTNNITTYESSLNRLKLAYRKTSYFTRIYYQKIFPNLSSSTISRDLAYGKRYNILTTFKTSKNTAIYAFTSNKPPSKTLFSKP